MKPIKYSLFFFLLIVILFSCRKDDLVPEPPPAPLYIPQEVKDYIYFKPGTYWIYKDSTTDIEDSVYVYYAGNNMDTLYNSNGSIKTIFEWFKFNAHSELDGYDYYYWVNMTWSTNDPTKTIVWRNKSKPGDYEGERLFLTYPFINGAVYYDYNTTITVAGFYNNLMVNNNLYNNVAQMNQTWDITENRQKTNIYISKHFGIIRKELIDSTKTWNLIRYNIVQ